jgi:hypothetical protein
VEERCFQDISRRYINCRGHCSSQARPAGRTGWRNAVPWLFKDDTSTAEGTAAARHALPEGRGGGTRFRGYLKTIHQLQRALQQVGTLSGNRSRQKKRGSNLGRNIGYPDGGISWFSADPPGKCWDSTSIRPRPLPSKSFAIHYSLMIVPFEMLSVVKEPRHTHLVKEGGS